LAFFKPINFVTLVRETPRLAFPAAISILMTCQDQLSAFGTKQSSGGKCGLDKDDELIPTHWMEIPALPT
jgi:hypothetical protein